MTTQNATASLSRLPLNALHAERPGVEWMPLGDARTPARFADTSDEAHRLAHCGLIDLSALPRFGLRGPQAAAALTERGYRLPEAPNRCLVQGDGTRLARLSATEYLLLGSLADAGRHVSETAQVWTTPAPGCYPLPRQDSHAWLALTGADGAAVMAKLCGVDLDAEVFRQGHIAQTSVARTDAIVIRDALGDTPCLHLLVDSASAAYLWPALLDAMQEFDGGPLGLDALLAPAAA
ncbi:hypothetical protein QO259_04580 [Salinicola sp. JS01]|uniref:hypothetical protein n=1 Tax=Salinicola sp. JS01 TaxID=3050071 RepID=UPI00255BC800|nr:hypothetical protein [Salinicola sp. JS01]WIX33948.1 hypothetical protein QO259_04580 [Salinicola sp. JS01]